MREYIISDNEAGQRFDKYLAKLFKNAPSGLIFKQLRGKNITLNKAKAKGNEKLKVKDVVQVFMADDTIDKFTGNRVNDIKVYENIPFNVVYEDDNIIIADKCAGVLSQKAKPSDISMNELLLSYLIKSNRSGNISMAFTPAFCNRLDRNTSGLMIAGISLAGSQKMSELIKTREIEKYYLALVYGRVENAGRISGYIKKDAASNKVTIDDNPDDGDYIDTEFEPLEYDDCLTLVKVRLITGKTHQIRAQMSRLGFPIVGDVKYGSPESIAFSRKKGIKRQLLHSYELIFPKLTDRFADISEMDIKSEYPEDFKRFFRWQRAEV